MRTSLNEIAELEKFIFRKLPSENRILFEARMILDKELKMKVFLQKKIYRLLDLFHKRELRKQAEKVFTSLMEKPEFQKEISAIFKTRNQ